MKIQAVECQCGCGYYGVPPLSVGGGHVFTKTNAEELARRWNSFEEIDSPYPDFSMRRKITKKASHPCLARGCFNQAQWVVKIRTSEHPGDDKLSNLCEIHTNLCRNSRTLRSVFPNIRWT